MRNTPADAARRAPHRFVHLLSVAQRRVQHWARGGPDGAVTSTQAGVLFLLGDEAGVLIGEVARALDLGPSGATGLIDRLEQGGLVERRPDQRDGRAARIVLTAQGRSLREAAKARAKIINDRLTDGFTEQELDVVARWLTTVRERFDKESVD